MLLCVVIEDEDRDYATIVSYIDEFKLDHGLSDADIRIDRFKTYEESAAVLRHVSHDQATLWIIDIRLLHHGNSDDIISGLLNTNVSPHKWPLIINSVFAREYYKRRIRRAKVEIVHKLEDPPDFPSARMKLRSIIHMFLEMLLLGEQQQQAQQAKDAAQEDLPDRRESDNEEQGNE